MEVAIILHAALPLPPSRHLSFVPLLISCSWQWTTCSLAWTSPSYVLRSITPTMLPPSPTLSIFTFFPWDPSPQQTVISLSLKTTLYCFYFSLYPTSVPFHHQTPQRSCPYASSPVPFLCLTLNSFPGVCSHSCQCHQTLPQGWIQSPLLRLLSTRPSNPAFQNHFSYYSIYHTGCSLFIELMVPLLLSDLLTWRYPQL